MSRTDRKLKAIKSISSLDFDVKTHYKVKRKLDKIKAIFNKPPQTYTVWNHNMRNGLRDIQVRIFTPPNANTEKMILFFHGGGWATGDIDSYRPVCVDLVKHTGHTVVAVNYRLAPEHKFPAGLDDCYYVAKSIYEGYFEDIIPDKAVFVGDSAGGNIAAAVSLMARDRHEFMPESQILIYPSTFNDHTPSSPFKSIVENGTDYLLTSKMIQDFLSLYESSPDDKYSPYFAPLLAEDYRNQPDTLLITAELCPLRDEGEFYGEKLAEAGNNVEIYRINGALHGFFDMPFLSPEIKETYGLINKFLHNQDPRLTNKDNN